MANRTITFSIEGKDNLTAALKSAADRIKSLANFNKSINAKALAQANRLQQAQAQLQNLNAYRKLQQAQAQAQKSYLALTQDMGKVFARRKAEVAQLESMRQAYSALQQAYKDNKRNMNAAQASAMKDALKSAKSELTAQENLIKGFDKSYDNAAASIAKLKTQLATQQAQLTQARAGLPAGTLAAHEMQLRAQIQQTTNALNAEIAALERRNQIANNFATANQNLSNAYSNFQSAVDTAQTIMNPFKDAAANAADFEFAMSRVKALTQMRNIKSGDMARVEREMALLTAQAEELGMATEFTRGEVAAAQGFFGMAGWDTSKILAGIKPVLDLTSIAGDHDLARMADVFSDIMTAMSLKPGQMLQIGSKQIEATQHFGDAMAYALTQSNMNREDFFQAMKYSAPIAATAGLSVGEEIAANMIVANSGIKGSQAGTGMRSGLLTLAGANKKAQAALQEVGMSSSDAQKQVAEAQETFNQLGVTGKTFSQRILQLGDAFSKMTNDEKLTNAYKIFGKNAATFWTKLLANPDSLKDFARYANEIDSGYASGWSQDTAAVMRDNTKTAIEYVKSALDALQGAAGDALLPAIRSAAEAITPLIASLAQWTKENPRVVQGLAAIAAAVSVATVSLAGFSLAMAAVRFTQAGIATAGLLFTDLAAKVTVATTALRGLTLANIGAGLSAGLTAAANAARLFGTAMMTAARSALMFVFTPVGAALTAIALAAYYAYQNWDKVSAAFSTIGDALSSSLVPAISSAMQALSTLGTAFAPISDLVGSLISYIGGGLVGAFIGLAGVVGSVLSSIIVGLAGVLKSVAEMGTGLVDAIGKVAEGDFAGAWASLTDSATQAAESFKSAWADSFATIKDGILATNDAINNFVASPPSVSSSVSAAANVSAIPAIDAAQVVQPLADASNQAATSLTQVQMPADAASQSLTQLPPSIDAVNASAQSVPPQLDALSAALPSPIAGLDALGGAASNAASALEGAAARISSIQINVPQINYVPMSVPVAANAEGGLYNRGSFLTTFAENYPEAAIPIDSSARSRSLWLETGDMLGMFDGQSAAPINISMTVNVAGDADKETAERVWTEAMQPHLEDFAEKLRSYEHERRRRSFN